MIEPSWADVDALFDRLLIGDDPALAAARAAVAAAGMPAIEVSPQGGKLLYLLAAAIGARRVLEIGTLGGYSTIWLARGVGASGRVVTLEYQPGHAEVARATDRVVRMLADRFGGALRQGGVEAQPEGG